MTEGTSVSIKFSVINDRKSGDISKHTVRKNGSDAFTEYEASDQKISLKNVKMEDKGTYTISCRNDAGEGSAEFKLDVIPPKSTIYLYLHVKCLNQ